MADLKQQVENRQEQMRKVAAEAAHADKVKYSLQATLSKERAEREQTESAAHKLQWVETQRAAERIASVEASARQQENIVEQIASAKVQSAFEELNKESRAWLHSEHTQQQITFQQMNEEILKVKAQCFSQEILAIQQVRQEADATHNERVAQLSQEANMKFQSQEVHMCALRDELAR